jgi:acetoin utilization protein AcuC
MNNIAIIYNEGLRKYDFGPGHPFRGERFPRYMELLKSKGILDDPEIDQVQQDPADDEDLLLVHEEDYVEKVHRLAETGYWLTRDTPLSQDIVEGARLVVGGAKKAVELVSRGYSLIDCVGGGLHHAGSDYGGGFCVFNDVAFCAKSFLERPDYDRVVILDTDVHAGNGTMDIFYDDPNVLFIDVHQDPLSIYPGRGFTEEIGEGEGEGYTVNIPLPPYTDNMGMKLVLEKVFKPLVEQFKPQAIIRNGGADPHFSDALGSLRLTYEGFHSIGKMVREASDNYRIPVVNMSCSGYNPKTVAEGMYAIFVGLLSRELDIKEMEEPEPYESQIQAVRDIISELSNLLKDY